MSDDAEQIGCGAPLPLIPQAWFFACGDDGAADVGGEEFPEEGEPAMGGGEVVPPTGGAGGAGAGAATPASASAAARAIASTSSKADLAHGGHD
jgi:hypothetical protein